MMATLYQVNSESFEHDETSGENFEEEEEEERLGQGARQRVGYLLANYYNMTICNKEIFANHNCLQKSSICRTATSDQVA